jgi:glycosyltransferase involved in cell wall biosynthesis
VLACRLKGIPFILDAKDPFSYLASRFSHMKKSRIKLFLYSAMEKLCLRLASHVFVLTPRDREFLGRLYGTPAGKISVIRNGSDTSAVRFDIKERVRARKRLGIPRGAKVVVYAGVIGGKELDSLLEHCCAAIKKQGVHLLFLFTHDRSAHADAMHKHMLGTIRRLSLQKQTHIIVNVPYSRLYKYLSAGDIALNPIPEFWETNIPTKVFDYLAAELPLATKAPPSGSMKDFFSRHDGGYFSSEWGDFAQKLERALKDPAFRRKGKRGRKEIERYFSRELFSKRALEILEKEAGK